MIRIVCVGKIKENYLAEMIHDYLLRINKYHRTEIVEVKDSNPETEAGLIIKQIPKQSFNVVMDIDGINLNSEQLSAVLENGYVIQEMYALSLVARMVLVMK